LITGITGQDGSLLADMLLEKGYAVSGLLRGSAERSLDCAEHLRGRISLIEGDLMQAGSLRAAIARSRPREIYHLAGPSFVPASWERPQETVTAIVGSCSEVLEAVRDIDSGMRVFVPASGGIFGDAQESPQRETTPCRPASPYAIAKLAAHQLVGAMRAHYGLYACSGIVFNHESERRPERFVTRRITRAAAAISLGLQQELEIGSLDAVRDWSYAGDVMEGAWLMLQQERAEDYVLASGVGHTVAELAQTAFACVDLDYRRYLRVDQALVRAPERTPNVGDASRARRQLGWSPLVDFQELVERMVAADLSELQSAAQAS
jgi:GDPmannose 4,6-dehydratase